MGTVPEICVDKKLNREEAESVLPLVHKLTNEISNVVQALIARLEKIRYNGSSEIPELEAQIDSAILQWETKIRKLGGIPKGLWLVDFDHGSGYYCWKFPEIGLRFGHGYNDGFLGRRRL